MKKNTDLRSVDGHTIYLPQEKGGNVGAGNIALPNIYTEDSVQKYPIGTRLEMGERTFRYFKAGTAMTNMNLGVVSYDCRLGSTVDSYDTAQAAGVGTVANPLKVDGSSAGDPAKNAYAGHYVVIYYTISATLGRRQMLVISSSASAADSINAVQTVELVLDQPTPVATAANTDMDFFPSRFADVRSCYAGDSGYLGGNMYPFVGVPMSTMTSGQWGWVLTEGPCFITCTSTELGDVSYDRTAIFNSDGSIAPCVEGWYDDQTANQIAGYTLADTDGSGSEWIMLQLE